MVSWLGSSSEGGSRPKAQSQPAPRRECNCPPSRQPSFVHDVSRQAAAGLVTTGLITGITWALKHASGVDVPDC